MTETIPLIDLTVAVEGLDHPEGVTVGPDGLVYAGGEAGQIYRVDLGAGTFEEIATTGGFLLGLCLDGAGRIYACDIGRVAVVRIDHASGSVVDYSRGTPERPMVNPNVGVFDDVGNLYVTDSGHLDQDDGCIFVVRPGGRTEVWSEGSTNFPNGACLSASGDALYVVESLTPALVRIPIGNDGGAGRREVVAELPGLVPDGVCLDVEGHAYVTCYRPDRIVRVAPSGVVDILADDPRGVVLAAPTNGVFAGQDLRTFVIASLGRWHLTAADFGVAGLPLRYPELGHA